MSRYRKTFSQALEEARIIEAGYLEPTMTPAQLNNIKNLWKTKKASDVTPAVKAMIKKMDVPTQLAIKHAGINHLSKLVEDVLTEGRMSDIDAMVKAGKSAAQIAKELKLDVNVVKGILGEADGDSPQDNNDAKKLKSVEEGFSPSQIERLKKEYEVLRGKKISVQNANKLSQMFKGIPDSGLIDIYKADIPFLSVMAMSKMVQKNIPRPAGVKLSLEEVEELEDVLLENLEITEGKISAAKFDTMKRGDSLTITYNSVMSGTTVKKFIVKGKSRSNKYNTDKITMFPDGNPGMARFFLYKRPNGEVSLATGDMAASIMSVKENFQDWAEAAEDMQKKPKEDDVEKLKNQNDQKDNEIAMLKQKAETDKAKNLKKSVDKQVNPETGEPLLQIGIAYKHLKDKMKKEETIVEFTSQQIKQAYGIANDPRYKQGNYTGAVAAIEKLAKGLSKHPDVQKVLKRTNESLQIEMPNGKAYAIGMSVAKKKYNDEPPLDKKTIKKGHEIADKLKKEQVCTKCGKDHEKVGINASSCSYEAGPTSEETIYEFKKMSVYFPNGAVDMMKASHLLIKKGFKVDQKGEYLKVDGKGADLNKYATDLKNFYGAKVQAESYTIDESADEDNYDPITEACWVGWTQKGMKKKGDRMVPNCVKENAPSTADMDRLKKQGMKPKLKNEDHPARAVFEQIEGLKNKAEKSGMPYGILKKVYDRGMAAWRGGHRPGTTQQQWAFARVNSFITKSSGTWGGADKDLAAKVKKEEVSMNEQRFEIEGTLSYKGIGSYDNFHMVIDAVNKDKAEDKCYDELDKARARKKIGPGGGGRVEDIEIRDINTTNDKLQAPTTYKGRN